jgi:hypothetical protein
MAPMKYVIAVFAALILILTSAWERSFPRMNAIANGEFLRYVSEYHVDTSGFSGPYLEMRPDDVLLYTWRKRKDDFTSAGFEVYVKHQRFSETVSGSSGSQEYWKILRNKVSP